jgi:hypothetical protein
MYAFVYRAPEVAMRDLMTLAVLTVFSLIAFAMMVSAYAAPYGYNQ